MATGARGKPQILVDESLMRWIQAYRAAKSFNHGNSIAELLNWTYWNSIAEQLN